MTSSSIANIFDVPAPGPDLVARYGEAPSQFGQLRLPQGSGLYPVAIVLHGGYWRDRYDLQHMGHLSAALGTEGIATWNLEYRRLGETGAGYPGTLQDAALGGDYVTYLAQENRLDLDRVIAIGHSAGGQLALWLGGRQKMPPDSPLFTKRPLELRSIIALAAVTDLTEAWEQRLSGGVVKDLLGGTPESESDRYALASPRALLPLGIPQVLVHGTADDNVPFGLSQDYVEAALEKGDPARLIALEGSGHFEPIDPQSKEWPQIVEVVRQLFS